jgi:hypothetical protein
MALEILIDQLKYDAWRELPLTAQLTMPAQASVIGVVGVHGTVHKIVGLAT